MISACPPPSPPPPPRLDSRQSCCQADLLASGVSACNFYGNCCRVPQSVFKLRLHPVTRTDWKPDAPCLTPGEPANLVVQQGALPGYRDVTPHPPLSAHPSSHAPGSFVTGATARVTPADFTAPCRRSLANISRRRRKQLQNHEMPAFFLWNLLWIIDIVTGFKEYSDISSHAGPGVIQSARPSAIPLEFTCYWILCHGRPINCRE